MSKVNETRNKKMSPPPPKPGAKPRYEVPHFIKISRSQYVDVDAVRNKELMGTASCQANRIMSIQCPKWCESGAKCTNRNFGIANPLLKKLQVFETTDGKGSGLKTRVELKARTFVIEYVGEVVSTSLFELREEEARKKLVYAVMLREDTLVDASYLGNVSRFLNHDKHPNCAIRKMSVNGIDRLGVFTIRDIAADEELTINYNFPFVL